MQLEVKNVRVTLETIIPSNLWLSLRSEKITLYDHAKLKGLIIAWKPQNVNMTPLQRTDVSYYDVIPLQTLRHH